MTGGAAYLNSIVIEYSTSSAPTTFAPTFTPSAGTYTSAQSVELTSATDGAKIYYTIDGLEPTNLSTPYSDAINVATTTTIKAIAYDADDANPSSVVSATYTIDLSPKITVTPASTNAMNGVYVGSTTTSRTLTVDGTNLTDNLTVALSGDNPDQFELSKTTIEHINGVVSDEKVIITYKPTSAGAHSTVVTISSPGMTSFTRTISGTAIYPPLAQPVASDATDVSSDSFTANWGEVEGATEYQVNVYTKTFSNVAADLFISEYGEGSSNNKYIEIYNGTGNNVDLSQYTLKQAANGGGWDVDWSYTLPLSGTIASGEVLVIVNSGASTVIRDIADIIITHNQNVQGGRVVSFTGNDAMGLFKNNILIDVFGDPTSDATISVSGFSTYGQDRTHVRKPSVNKPNTDWVVSSGTNVNDSEWLSYASDTWTHIGSHTMSGSTTITPVAGSPFTSTTNSYQVTSLTPSTEYFYTITAKNANVTSPISIEYMVTTLEETIDPIYRTVTSGNWSVASTWEVSNDNGETWVEAADVPSLDNDGSAIIQNGHEVTLNSDEMISQVTIQPNGKLTVNPGVSFTATSLELQNDATGTATILGNVSGTVTINQAVEGMRSYYLGSPFSTLTSITGITGVATFDVTSDAWTLNTTDPKSAIPAIGNGFLAQVGDAATTHITLSGTLNAENVPFTLVTDATKKFNYVGNPYPSYLNAKQLVEYYSTVEPSLWFRTKTGGAYQFETYNVPADVSIPAASASNNGFIAPLQGFWVKANEAGTAFAFTDAMRTHNTTGVNLPLKAPKVSENKILRLQVINGSEFDETVVLFNSNAQNGFDKYDASKMMNTGANALNIYTKLGSDNLVLNSQSAIQYDSEIPLEVKTAKIGTFTIKANEFSNFGNFDKVQLKNEAGLITDLTLGDYTFTTSAENATTRFALIFPSNAPTGTDNFEMKSARVMALDNRIIIDTNDSFLGTTVSVYNQVGQRVAMQTINSNKTEINGQLSAGVYLVKLNNQSFKVLLK